MIQADLNSLLWGGVSRWVPRSAPVGLLRGFPFWAFRLRWVRACYVPTAPQQHNIYTTPTPTPYPTSTRSRLLYTPTFLSIPPTLQFELYHGYSGTSVPERA
jgi:hypothetical protein